MKRRVRKSLAAVLAAVAFWFVSCREVPSPEGGILSISGLLLPSPGVVAGDTMRDSTGLVAPLRVIAFDAAGDTVQNPATTFVIIDTVAVAHLAGALLVGDTIGTVRVVGAAGALQTQPASVKVTVSPDTLVAADSVLHRKTYSASDTAATSADLATIVRHLTPATTVEAVVVYYSITRAPPGDATKGPTVVLTNGGFLSSRDTTDSGGRAARAARLRTTALTASAADTAIVTAFASYRGRTLGTVTFVVIFTRQ